MALPMKVVLSEAIWKRKWWVMYLVVVDKAGLLDQVTIDERFEKVLFQQVSAYLEKGEMPPAEIAPAVLNMADDHLAGRQVVLRAGDYIAVQNFLRKKTA